MSLLCAEIPYVVQKPLMLWQPRPVLSLSIEIIAGLGEVPLQLCSIGPAGIAEFVACASCCLQCCIWGTNEGFHCLQTGIKPFIRSPCKGNVKVLWMWIQHVRVIRVTRAMVGFSDIAHQGQQQLWGVWSVPPKYLIPFASGNEPCKMRASMTNLIEAVENEMFLL